jgi:thymidylate synthase
MDVWQKGHGNFLSMAILSDHICQEISAKIGKDIRLGAIDGMICDGHIYHEKYAEAQAQMAKFNSESLIPANL